MDRFRMDMTSHWLSSTLLHSNTTTNKNWTRGSSNNDKSCHDSLLFIECHFNSNLSMINKQWMKKNESEVLKKWKKNFDNPTCWHHHLWTHCIRHHNLHCQNRRSHHQTSPITFTKILFNLQRKKVLLSNQRYICTCSYQ